MNPYTFPKPWVVTDEAVRKRDEVIYAARQVYLKGSIATLVEEAYLSSKREFDNDTSRKLLEQALYHLGLEYDRLEYDQKKLEEDL